jgi:hypothetical protein
MDDIGVEIEAKVGVGCGLRCSPRDERRRISIS